MGFRIARKKAGLTLEQVSAKLGVSPAAISGWENGKMLPEAGRLVAIADLYACTVDELLRAETGE